MATGARLKTLCLVRSESVCRVCLLVTFVALGVLQTETGFVTFGHFGSVEAEQVVECEHLHAVVVSAHTHAHMCTHTHGTLVSVWVPGTFCGLTISC